MSEAANVVTSENSAEFYANKLGLATEPTEPVEEAPEVPEEAVESEPEEQKPVVEQEKKPNPKLEKRFSELTKQRELARQEAERERQARADLEQRIKELEAKSAPQVSPDEEPKPEQFRDAYEYAKALAEFSAEKALKERDKQEAERKAQESRQQLLSKWAEKQSAVKAELPDYEDMIASSDVAVSDQVRDAILESDVGPRILYHLAENPEVAHSINAMTVQSALRMIGKLEARFEKTQEEPAPKPVATKSKAPAPINPIRGAGAVPDVSDAEKMDYQQWKAARKAGKIR